MGYFKKYNNHSDLPWESGKDGGSIISKDEKLIEAQNKSSLSQNGYDCREYYGGAVVCETIGKSDQEFILHATKCFYDNVEVKILRIIQEISRKDELLSCVENKIAIQMLEASLYWLNERTRKRKEQQVEGTNKPHHS